MAAETTPEILATAPFGAGSVGLGLHPLTHLPARDQVATILAQARAAETAGFDGVTVSEHHAGFPSYLPQPLLVANWILADTTRLWSGPGPLLLSLRNPALVAEEIAWTAARFPGRVGIAVAPGYVATDFEAVGETKEQVKQFHPKIDRLVQALSADGPLAADPAVSRWAATPGPVMVAANSKASIEHTAAIGAGVVFPGGQDPDRHGRLAALYRDLGGKGAGGLREGRYADHGAADADRFGRGAHRVSVGLGGPVGHRRHQHPVACTRCRTGADRGTDRDRGRGDTSAPACGPALSLDAAPRYRPRPA